MPPLSLSDVFVRSPDVLCRELEGESVLLQLETGVYFGLNAVGTRLWSLLGEGSSLQQVCDALGEEFDVAPARIEQDVLDLVAELCARGLARGA